MKDKVKTLAVATMVLSQMTVGGSAVWAAEMPVGNLGPEVYIQKIIPDEQKIVMYHHDQGGRDREQWIENLNVVWPKEANGDDVVVELEDVEPSWANTFFNGDAQAILISGWSGEVQKQAEAPDLQENIQNVLYFSVQLRSHNPALDRMYWSDKANYNDCMQYYQPGIVCEAKIEEGSVIRYYPYLNGVLLGGQNQEESGLSSEPSLEPDSTGETEPEQSDTGDLSESEITETKSTEPVLLAGVGSAIIDSGSGGARMVVPAEQAEVDDESAESVLVAENEEAEAITLSEHEEELEVPELGGEPSSDSTQGYGLLALIALAVAAGALMIYWWIILPLIKRKKEDENTENSV